MHRPVVGDSWGKRKARAFVTFCEGWLIKSIIRPIFFLLPPMIVNVAASEKGVQDDITRYLSPTLASFVNSSALLAIVGTYIYVVLLKAIYSGIKSYSKPARELDVTDVLAILKALTIVVGDKSKRFANQAKNSLQKKSVCPQETFKEITKPEQQIALLIFSLRTVFEIIDDHNAFFRVGLLRVENGKPVDWIAFEPESHPPRTKPEQLASPSSSVAHAIRTKSIIVVSDIQYELSRDANKYERKFLRGNTKEGEQGSQLAFPVIHPATGSVEYVITIAGSKKLCLVEEHAELYSWIIEHFSVRISLEHSLLILKEKADEHQRAA